MVNAGMSRKWASVPGWWVMIEVQMEERPLCCGLVRGTSWLSAGKTWEIVGSGLFEALLG
jgi:hypothetical protein